MSTPVRAKRDKSGKVVGPPRRKENQAANRATTIAPKSEGHRLLLLVDASFGEMARACGIKSKQSCAWWISGEKTPAAEARRAIAAAYSIPVVAWDQPPKLAPDAVQPPETTQPEPPPEPPTGGTTLGEVLGLVDRVSTALRSQNLTGSEELKLIATKSKLLQLRAKLESDAESLEARIVDSHPRFQQVMRAIVESLRPHPEALKDVHQSLLALQGR